MTPDPPASFGDGPRHAVADATSGETPLAGPAQRLLLVANPHASTTNDAVLRHVSRTLSRRHRVDAVLTEHQAHAIELCRTAAAEGYDAVVVLGGDGTINEAANGLAGSSTALAPLPGGATNVYTRMLGMPRAVVGATERLAGATPAPWRDVDLGRVNDRWFTFAAGVGLDASTVERVDRHPRRKARWGRWFFASVGLSVFVSRYLRHPPRLEVELDDRRLEAVTVLLQNGNPYTYFGDRPIVLDPDGGVESGDLGGVALTRASAVDLPPILWRALSGRPVSAHPRVESLRTCDRLVVRSLDGRPVPLQVDGDHLGAVSEVRVSVVPRALRVLG